jgi:hypothetical protein
MKTKLITALDYSLTAFWVACLLYCPVVLIYKAVKLLAP